MNGCPRAACRGYVKHSRLRHRLGWTPVRHGVARGLWVWLVVAAYLALETASWPWLELLARAR